MKKYINNKEDLKYFLNIELGLIKKNCKKRYLIFPYVIYEERIKYRFIKNLRKAEYHCNCNHKIRGFLYKNRHYHLQNKYLLNIPMNSIDVGLNIAHVGPITINDNCIIGKNFKVYPMVVIGNNEFKDHVSCPKLGDNVYVGSGAKIIGNISIADGCIIGCNSVVTKSFDVKNAILVGIPAQIKKLS